MKTYHFVNATLFIVFLVAPQTPAFGEITNAASDGFQITISDSTRLDQSTAFQSMIDDFSSWWDASHSYSGDAANLSLDLEEKCMLEKLPNQGFVRHMEIVYLQRGEMIRMTGGLGPLQEMGVHGILILKFASADDQTRITLNYNVSGATFQNLDQLAGPVEQVLRQQLSHLKTHCESKVKADSNRDPDND